MQKIDRIPRCLWMCRYYCRYQDSHVSRVAESRPGPVRESGWRSSLPQDAQRNFFARSARNVESPLIQKEIEGNRRTLLRGESEKKAPSGSNKARRNAPGRASKSLKICSARNVPVAWPPGSRADLTALGLMSLSNCFLNDN